MEEVRLKFHPEISHEIKKSYTWYQEQATGLGGDFLDEPEDAYQVISQLPGTWPLFQKGFRRYRHAQRNNPVCENGTN